jgi:putative oxidoreductase
MASVLLIIRLFFGLAFAAHGAQKLFGWFGGHGLEGTGSFFEQLGYRPGRLFATAAGLGEFGGGLLLASGLFGPIGPALMLVVMLVASLTVHAGNGFFAMNDGVEMPLLYAAAAILFAYTGPGAYALDTVLGLTALHDPAIATTALGIGVLVALINFAFRHPSAEERQTTS